MRDEMKEAIDRRLSGLQASESRRQRIRHAVRMERRPIKRSVSLVLAAVLLAGTFAAADHLDLFSIFGRWDERYAHVASEAVKTTATPVQEAVIDSAYFDGLSLNIALRIGHAQRVEPYAPTKEELAQMQPVEALPQALEMGQIAPMVEAYNAALESGTAYGYRVYSVEPGDHVFTDDGIDIPPSSAMPQVDESGTYLEMREFETPLPEEIAQRDGLNVRISLYESVTEFWFDGTSAYRQTTRREVGELLASIPRTEGTMMTLQGRGQSCQVTTQVSKTAMSMSLSCDHPLSDFLQGAPEESWLDLEVRDEEGRRYRPDGGLPTDGASATLSFAGTGVLPKSLTVSICLTSEEAQHTLETFTLNP